MSQQDSNLPTPLPPDLPGSSEWKDEELPPIAPQQIVPKPNFAAKKIREEGTPAQAAGDAAPSEPGVTASPENQSGPNGDPGVDPTNPSTADLTAGDAPPAPPTGTQESGEAPATPLQNPDPEAGFPADAPGQHAVPTASGEFFQDTLVNPAEKRWLGILVAVLVLAGGLVFYLLKDALPSDSRYRATLTPELPIKGAKITIKSAEARWRQLGSKAEAATKDGLRICPEIALTFSPESTGALRIFFRNERDQQVGDTINMEIQGGRVIGGAESSTATGTRGLRTILEYADLSAGENTHWSIEIHEGTDPRGPMSGYSLLAKISVPWNFPSPTQQ